MYEIIPFQPGDVKEILILEEELFNPPYTANQLLQDPCAIISLIKIEGKVVAYLYAHLLVDEIEIYHIGVKRECSRKGFASALLNDLLVKYNNTHEILLEVKDDNEAAISLYNKMGFTTYYIRKAYYDDGKDALLMRMKRR